MNRRRLTISIVTIAEIGSRVSCYFWSSQTGGGLGGSVGTHKLNDNFWQEKQNLKSLWQVVNNVSNVIAYLNRTIQCVQS